MAGPSGAAKFGQDGLHLIAKGRHLSSGKRRSEEQKGGDELCLHGREVGLCEELVNGLNAAIYDWIRAPLRAWNFSLQVYA